MINARELMIGNWVKVANKIGRVTDLHTNPDEIYVDISPDYPYMPEDVDGVVLTPEILKRAGFVLVGREEYALGQWLPTLKLYRGIYQVRSVADCFVEYVHQLQVLHLILTGEELIFNLKRK